MKTASEFLQNAVIQSVQNKNFQQLSTQDSLALLNAIQQAMEDYATFKVKETLEGLGIKPIEK